MGETGESRGKINTVNAKGNYEWILPVCRKKITTRMRLLATYVVFILMETVIGRKPGIARYELVPLWSYSHPELRMEIILNYILFIPLGFLLYFCFGEKRKHGCVWIAKVGFLLSASIEIIQLVFRIGLFEFDDMIGNTIGCLIGAVVGKMVEKMLVKRGQT